MQQYQSTGIVIKGVGGLFTVRIFPTESGQAPQPLDGYTVFARARGNLRKKGELLVGDRVQICYDDSSFTQTDGTVHPCEDGTGISVDTILPRSSGLIRPPMANLNYLFITVASAAPDPICLTVDKLISIAEYHSIQPVLLFTKAENNPGLVKELANVYQRSGFPTFVTDALTGEGIPALADFIRQLPKHSVSAFSGASGVGKSTLLNALFPQLHFETGEISRRIERGKNTTRCVSLFPISDTADSPLLADTPGFTMLDFERFDFFDLEDLPSTFREFQNYLGNCKYRKCTHTKEEGCAILEAVKNGEISPSRQASYTALYDVLKKKNKWDK